MKKVFKFFVISDCKKSYFDGDQWSKKIVVGECPEYRTVVLFDTRSDAENYAAKNDKITCFRIEEIYFKDRNFWEFSLYKQKNRQ